MVVRKKPGVTAVY